MKNNRKQITDSENFRNEFNLGFCPRSLFLLAHFALFSKNNSKTKNKTKMKSLMTTFLILILGFGAIAQEEIQTRPFQISFITPLGTNGIESVNINNNFSINLFGGYNGGLDGLEVSGFAGILKNNMKGTQIAGFGNIVLKEGDGAQ